jgi:hypothetical protein
MISVSSAVPINPPGEEPTLSRDDVWQGLLLKTEDALPFVPAMTRCEVLEHYDDGLLREVDFRGQTFRERITLEPKHRVRFDRVPGGPVDGFILNEIEEDADGQLELRFSFNLSPAGMEADSEEERAYEKTMSQDYLKAVGATLSAVRRMVAERHPAIVQ